MDTAIDDPIPYALTDALTLLARWQSAGDRECRMIFHAGRFRVTLTQYTQDSPMVSYNQWGEDLELTVLAALVPAMETEGV